jgi:hypothetical protein
MTRGGLVAAFLVAILASSGCRSTESTAPPVASSTPDRLAPGEKPSGTTSVFGIPVPPKLEVLHEYRTRALLEGRARSEDLAAYFREYVHVQHVEVTATGMVFPRVHIKGDPLKREFRIDIEGRKGFPTRVKIVDITKTPGVPAKTEAETWEQAGRNPDGTIKDRLKQF